MVTKANNSNVLTGNDWLKMAGMLRIRLDPVRDVHKDVTIDIDHHWMEACLKSICVNLQDAKQCNA